MKRNWINRLIVSTLLLILVLVSACHKGEEHTDHDTYTCPMHPTVASEVLGICPICGMDLVRKTGPGEEVEISGDLAQVIQSPNESVIASIETITGKYKAMPVSIEAQGIVTYDTRNIYTIPSRVGGRLERVFLEYPFQRVHKGQKVAEIYSPELLNAQRELLFLKENDDENQSLIESAKDRLRLLGATETQINELIRKGKPKNTFTIYSPYDGYVIPENPQLPLAPRSTMSGSVNSDAVDGGMSASSDRSSPISSPQDISNSGDDMLIREGSYVATGQTLFKIVNNSSLRVELNIPSAIVGSVSKGSEVLLNFGDGNQQKAIVDFIQPFYNEGEQFQTIRVYTKNIEKLHIGHLVNAVVKGKSVEALWIPKDAVLDLGVDKIVFIKDKKVLRPKKVVTGSYVDDLVEIKQGLSSTDEIAASAQYLIDSESFIKIPR